MLFVIYKALRRFYVFSLVLVVVIFCGLIFQSETGLASLDYLSVAIGQPIKLGGESGYDDQRDADIYPAIAYNSNEDRYLVVWMTPRNANSSSDGLDIYGKFLNRNGNPISDEFRITDNNNAARNSMPAIVAGIGEFVVAWTVRGKTCEIHLQRISDTTNQKDQLLSSDGLIRHSPSIVFNPARNRYLLVYVEGNDYLPPTLFGSETTDCGNDASSTSSIMAVELNLNDGDPIFNTPLDITDVNGGAFRPSVSYSNALGQYLVAWEDRRNSFNRQYVLDVYAQRLNFDLSIVGSDIPLSTGVDYTNFDSSATWTPRPVVVGSESNFLVTWFTRVQQEAAVIWSVEGKLIYKTNLSSSPFTIMQMPFAQSHSGNSPTGFLSAAYSEAIQGYLVGITSYLESIWGYLSFSLIQHISKSGQLYDLNGNVQSKPSVGYSIDYENDDQIGISITANSSNSLATADYLVAYSKHAKALSERDFDIWGVPILLKGNIFLPLVHK